MPSAKSAPATATPQTAPLSQNSKNVVKAVAYPAHYYDYADIHLQFVDKHNRSVDETGAKTYKIKQNVPLDYVTQLQNDLTTLGYLPNISRQSKKSTTDGYFGSNVAYAVKHFQRHVKTNYRMTSSKARADVSTLAFLGAADGVCDHHTAVEIQLWIENGWALPLGRFSLTDVTLPSGHTITLREDAAAEWEIVLQSVAAAGGTLDGPYADALRGISFKAPANSGASSRSFHYTGRAIDINWSLASRASKTYYVVKDGEFAPGRPFWRIFCKTKKQDGSQGHKKSAGSETVWDFYDLSTYRLPEGYYLDLTAEITKSGLFERIPAWTGWDAKTSPRSKREKLPEWWHFQYNRDKQKTFQDEMELIGFSEPTLLEHWSLEDIQKRPG